MYSSVDTHVWKFTWRPFLTVVVEYKASDPIVLGDHSQTLSEIWNGDQQKRFAKDFLAGDIPECDLFVIE